MKNVPRGTLRHVDMDLGDMKNVPRGTKLYINYLQSVLKVI